MLKSAIYTVRYSAAYALELMKFREKRAGRTTPRETTHALMLIPGWLAPNSVVNKFEVLFERNGIPAFSFHIGMKTLLPFDRIVDQIEAQIRLIRKEVCPDLRGMGIVGHSMGGLIGLDLIDRGVFDGLDCRIATLGTPHTGTWPALLGCAVSLSAYQLLPFHPRFWKGGLNPRLKDIPFLSIAGAYDVLAPPGRCVHPQATNLLMDVDHAGLIQRKAVFKEVLRFMQQDFESTTSPSNGHNSTPRVLLR